MKIYTRVGDKGTTGLFTGTKVSKADLRVKAYGEVDELNCFLGLIRSALGQEKALPELDRQLGVLQEELFELGADLATPGPGASEQGKKAPRISSDCVERLEKEIDQYALELPELRQFILPGGARVGALLHVARSVCRRAERQVVEAAGKEKITPEAIRYLNRLSDWLFTAARWANKKLGQTEQKWRATQ